MCGRIDLMCFKIPRHLTFFAPVQNQITGVLLLNQGQIVFPRNNVNYAQMLGWGRGGSVPCNGKMHLDKKNLEDG
jgi:hypothetical protein